MLTLEGFSVFLDPMSSKQLGGATVDFLDDVMQSGFRVFWPSPKWNDPVAQRVQDVLDRGHPLPSLLLADVVLPGGLDGGRLVSEARRRLPALPALLMSGYAAHAGATRCDNGIRLLPKPFRRAELALALAEELRAARVA